MTGPEEHSLRQGRECVLSHPGEYTSTQVDCVQVRETNDDTDYRCG